MGWTDIRKFPGYCKPKGTAKKCGMENTRVTKGRKGIWSGVWEGHGHRECGHQGGAGKPGG